ncbi:glycosyltransferase [Pseudomonas nicosulfuronedens]|nr:glycosyltransferase [Pseudomonas nicosulfuronedens]MDH1982535.1 glycosyltransferase [Pseudomonas nicosulfuronedens]
MRPVTAVLINFRDAQRTCKCVKSILREQVDQVLVWDNSEDAGRSAAAVREALQGEPLVQIEVCSKNLGFAAGANRAIESARRDRPDNWILLINNDATLREGALGKMAEVLADHQQTQLVSPRINHAGIDSGPLFYHRWTGLQFRRPRPGSFAFPTGCCLLVAPERIALPLFDEVFFMYGEDVALGARLQSVAHLPEVLVDHEGSASSGLGSRFYEERLVAAHCMLARALARNAIEHWAMLLVRLPLLLARATLRSLRFRSLLPLRALYGGMLIAAGKDPLRSPVCAASGTPATSQRLP